MASSLRLKISASLFTVISLFTLTGVSCSPTPVNIGKGNPLVIWGLWEESTALEPIITAFQEETGVDVEYRKIASVADYENQLLAAIAEDRGPDIFVIHHTWVETKRGLMSPASPDIIDERALREEFVDVVADDLIRDGHVYALPTSVDTLALYYNKDLLSTAGIARPPRTWDEFLAVVERITRINRLGVIEQSAAALGTATNISRATDIIQLLFIQSGLSLNNDDNKVRLSEELGVKALTFYTDFANKSKKAYTWNIQQDYSIDAFSQGKTAMMINYSYHIPTVRAKNPRLRFDIAPVPQIADSKVQNFASYWPYAVSNKSKSPELAWQFLRQMTNTEGAMSIIRHHQIPPARRDGVASLSRDPSLGVFAEQALTAVTWPRGDIVAIDAIMNTMIDNVIPGAAPINASLVRAQEQINLIQPDPVQPAAEEPISGGLQQSR